MTNIIEVRSTFVNSFIIYDNDHTVLIDTGFIRGYQLIEKHLKSIGRSVSDITHIFLTHGHLDHSFNLAQINMASNAIVLASPKEQIHVDGNYNYKGWARVCGVLEAMGRGAFSYKSAMIDEHLEDNQVINICGGIKAIHLPGHTEGHLGFLHLESNILFSGDMIEIRKLFIAPSPAIFNSCFELYPNSLQKMLNMDIEGIYSNHGSNFSPLEQLQKFKQFASNYLSKRGLNTIINNVELQKESISL